MTDAKPDPILAEALKSLEIPEATPESQLLELPHLLLQLLFQSRYLRLGRMIHIVGEQSSLKTTLSLEIARWHVANGGYAVTLHTEGRVSEELAAGVLGEYKDRHIFVVCDSLEAWQRRLLQTVEYFSQRDIKNVCIILDSVLGCNAQEAIDATLKSGCASPRFGLEARLVSDFLRSFIVILQKQPFTFCVINHRKFRPNPITPYYGAVKSFLGGAELGFYASYDLELKRIEAKSTLGSGMTCTLSIRTEKNTYGTPNIEIQVPVQFTNDGQLRVIFQWDEALAVFLAEGKGVKPEPSRSILNTIKELIGLNMRSGGRYGRIFWSSVLGIPYENAVPASKIVEELFKRPETIATLQRLLGIK